MNITRRGRSRRRTALLVSGVLVGTLLQGTLTGGTAQADDLPGLPAAEKPVAGHHVTMKPRTTDRGPRTPEKAPKRHWPEAASATLTLPVAGAASRAVRADGMPLTLTVPKAAATKGVKGGAKGAKARGTFTGKATVRLLDRATSRRVGVDGPLFTLTPRAGATGGTVGVSVDYAGFAQAFGGGYDRRVTLVQLPACVLTTPKAKGCSTPQPLATHNDPKSRTLSATGVTLAAGGTRTAAAGATVLAVAAEASGDKGDYTASQLSASSTWSTDLSTGSFSWSYEFPPPKVPGGLAPKVGLAYSSGGIDGRTSNTNNQSSWVGDGFDLWPGFIERSYKSCADDGVKNADGKKPGDLCWAYDNATLSMSGHSGELIPVGNDTFKLKGDDGTKVQRVYGTQTSPASPRGNGARNDEYWRVTTTDGTRYYFGYHRLPGWASGKETTDSTWTVPVFGDDAGEPCHASAFADSWCQQGWRWNLDYVVDVHGNAMAYYYDKESNYYARNLKVADETVYDRGGSLDRIEYGLRDDAVYSAKALAKVDFTSKERCLPQSGVTCAASTIDDKAFYWYDTPWDLNCKSGADCTKSVSPSFWTRQRLTGVSTQVLQSDGTYKPVDEWALDHKWGMADIDYQLLLASIQHTGKSVTPAVTLPKVTFGYDQRANRLDVAGDDTAPFIKERLATVADESGGQTDITYSAPACDADSLPTPQTNTTRCFPVYFTKSGDADPSLQWFNRYVVDAVTRTDRTNSSPDQVTRYDYLGGAAWHFDDDDGLTKEKYKTWSSYRGYAHVRVRTGGQDPVGMKSQTDHWFLRGMDGDKAAPSGGTRSVVVKDDNGDDITDHDSATGFEYKTENYDGPGGKVLSKTLATPWHHETARRERSWGTTTANLTGTLNTSTWTSLDGGVGTDWRKTSVSFTHEKVAGRVTATNDSGDTSTAADNQCTRTTYVDNTTDWVLTRPYRVETVGVACSATPDRSKDVLADTYTAFDGQTYGTAPTKGDATRTATLKSHDGTTGTYLESGASYDAYGRQLTATDITATATATETTAPKRTDRTDGRTVTTAYTPATGFPTTVKTTNPPATAGNAATAQTSTTTLDTTRGLPVTSVDTNNKRTDTTYDALGRKLKIWLPNRSKANSDIPTYEFAYTTTENKPVVVATKTLRSGTAQQTSYQYLDGFLQARQAQVPGPDGGMLVSDTFYDERGLTAKSFAPYYNSAAPGSGLLKLDNALSVETQTWNTYDGLGRVTKSQQVAGNGDGGKVLATTTTAYDGDRVTVTPPKGGTPTTTVLDARGRTAELWQYPDATPTGTPDKTRYSYTTADGPNPEGALAKITDPAGNAWSYRYDQRGNQVESNDPDKGKVTSRYDDRDQLTSSTGVGRGKTVARIYDDIGRLLETHEDSATGPLLTRNTWDPSGFKGLLASSTSYVGGASGAAYTTTVNEYDTLHRPNRVTMTVPATTENGKLAGSYQTITRYNENGTVKSIGLPAAGSLAADVLTPTYDELLRPKTLSGTGGVTYITDTNYSLTGKPLQYRLQSGAKFTQITNTYEWGTQRLSNSRVDRQDVPGVDRSTTYGYDDFGNIRALTDVSRDGTDNQCFRYDYLGRMTEAWAQNTTQCATTPTVGALGGPAPYWYSYDYDKTGNRKTWTLHDPSGDTGKDEQRSYSYPDPGTTQPHTLKEVRTTGPSGVSVDSFTYDAAGNTETRTIHGDKQSLVWRADDKLSQVTQPDGSGGTKTTSYVYDADGNRLIRRTDAGTTLYLGTTEITLAKGSTTPKATRYYDLGGGNQAVRTDDGKLSFLIGDHHGTAELAVAASDLGMQQRRTTPFGGSRGSQPANWPGEKGFIGGTVDPTGLTHLGAREYDPETGRFISVDPILDTANPQQLNGFAYSNNNPVTASDPSGLESCYPHYCSASNGTDMGSHYDDAKDPESMRNKDPGLYAKYHEVATESAVNDWIRWWTPKDGTDRSHLRSWFSFYGGKDFNSTFGDYWKPEVDGQAVCFGRLGCKKASDYLDKHPDDELGARRIAATYCVQHAEQCEMDAHIFEGVKGLWEMVPTLVAGAFGRRTCWPNSFAPETRILMADGSTKPIAEVEVGDKVLAEDPETGKTSAQTVTAEIKGSGLKHLVRITLRTETKSGSEQASITATDGHPFWLPALRTWVTASDLKSGQWLKTANGDLVQITSVKHWDVRTTVRNLTVANVHTYYVLAGGTPVLVHNSHGAPDVTRIQNLHGMSLDDANDYLERNGFTLKSWSDGKGGKGGYMTYQSADGSKITIRDSDGRVTRTTIIDNGPNKKNGVQRWDESGKKILSHNHGEAVKC
ncbi:polymorphic toxin-type HINT domain-containing protein [Streptomyces antibioticus]